MARSFYRAMLISSFMAASGSFLIDLGTALTQIAAFLGIELHAVTTPDRTFAVLACVMVIAVSAMGLIIIRLIRGWPPE